MNANLCSFIGMWNRWPMYILWWHFIWNMSTLLQPYKVQKLLSILLLHFYIVRYHRSYYYLFWYSTFSTVVKILLKVALNTINHQLLLLCVVICFHSSLNSQAWLNGGMLHWLLKFQFRSPLSTFWLLTWGILNGLVYGV